MNLFTQHRKLTKDAEQSLAVGVRAAEFGVHDLFLETYLLYDTNPRFLEESITRLIADRSLAKQERLCPCCTLLHTRIRFKIFQVLIIQQIREIPLDTSLLQNVCVCTSSLFRPLAYERQKN